MVIGNGTVVDSELLFYQVLGEITNDLVGDF